MMECELIVFDFDFTIAKTVEQMWVWSPRGENYSKENNKRYNRIHPTELQQLGISDDELIDDNSFFEFHNLNVEKAKVVTCVIPYLQYYSQKFKTYILSARPSSIKNDLFLFFEKNNIDSKNIEFHGLQNSLAEFKISWIDQKIKEKNYKKLVIFEDNKNLIDIAIKKYVDIEINIYYIQNYSDKTIIIFYEH